MIEGDGFCGYLSTAVYGDKWNDSVGRQDLGKDRKNHREKYFGCNDAFQYIPLESQIQSFQEGYYDAISECHKNGNSDAFIIFMLKRIDELLEDVLKTRPLTGNDEAVRVARLLNCMEAGKEYSAAELMLFLGLKSRKTFRENYLQPAMAQGTVKMTDPEHPRNRNQKYFIQK